MKDPIVSQNYLEKKEEQFDQNKEYNAVNSFHIQGFSFPLEIFLPKMYLIFSYKVVPGDFFYYGLFKTIQVFARHLPVELENTDNDARCYFLFISAF